MAEVVRFDRLPDVQRGDVRSAAAPEVRQSLAAAG